MKIRIIGLLLLFPLLASAEPAGVLKLSTDRSVDDVYTSVYKALEDEKFWVVFESDMSKRMAKFADKWGEDYNRSGLESVQSMVFCNIWWTNQIANADPDLLALCPLHLSLYSKEGKTHVVMPRLSVIAEGSPGRDKAAELEAELKSIVEKALANGE
jgi:uncharacterized protein (DUF302 family)